MNNKKQTILSILAACAMLASFCACGDDTSSSESAASKAESGTTTSTSDSNTTTSASDSNTTSASDSSTADSAKADDSSKQDDDSKTGDASSKQNDSSKKDESSKAPVASDAKKADTGTTSYANSRAKKFNESLDAKQGTMNVAMAMDMLGMEINYDAYMTYDLSGKGQMYMDMNMSGAGESMHITAVAINGAVVTVNHTTKEYTKETGEGDNLVESMLGMDMTDMLGVSDGKEPTFKETGKATVDGTACVYETFSVEMEPEVDAASGVDIEVSGSSSVNYQMTYYFNEKNDAFEKIAIADAESGEEMYVVNEFSNKADATKFKMPDLTGYTEMTEPSLSGGSLTE